MRSSITIRQNAAWSFPFNKRKEPENEETSSKENVPKEDIDMTLAIEKWDKRLKSAEVGNREHNLKSLLAHILGVQAVRKYLKRIYLKIENIHYLTNNLEFIVELAPNYTHCTTIRRI